MQDILAQENYGLLIEVTMKKIKNTLQKKLNRGGFDLTVDQWVVLDQLVKQDGLNQQELGQKVYKDAPTVTRIIDLLVKKHMVARIPTPEDRRKFRIQLTQLGMDTYEEVLPEVKSLRTAGWSNLNDNDMTELFRILRKIHANLDEHQSVLI